MPPLPGFSDNQFRDRSDVELATLVLLQSLCKFQSPGGARIRMPVASGTHFDEAAADLEGFARPLWAIAALLAGSDAQHTTVQNVSSSFARGLAHGTDPEHAEYWGPVVVRDQRMVEMEIIAFALLAAPKVLYEKQDPAAKVNIKSWLMTINGKDMPTNNWRWFRVLTNLALIKVCGVPADDLQNYMETDLNLLDEFYITDGWSGDGLWNDGGRQADYYSGSFAVQFSQMMYVKFAEDLDPKRSKTYRERAYLFSKDFWHYFSPSGAAIPFGRSLTYRFACAGFWAAAAYAEVELSPPVQDLGMIKGLLMRHLRWWASKPDIFYPDGTLNIGFTYPNMYMCEDYNSPQSVYWCMKSFCCLGFSANHPFWTAQEQAHPQAPLTLSHIARAPMQIICASGSHHFLLSSGQFCPWPLKGTEAKYGKFAYSSHFGFSVPTGPLLEQIAPDNTLALRLQHDDSWKVRWISESTKFSTAKLHTANGDEQIPVLVACWKPWKLHSIEVHTALIATTPRWPEWHIRVHKIIVKSRNAPLELDAVEGGFAIYGRTARNGLPIPPQSLKHFAPVDGMVTVPEVSATFDGSCLVSSSQGMSGILALKPEHGSLDIGLSKSEGHLLKPDSNTNLMRPRTVIPTIKSTLHCDGQTQNNTFYLATGIFATDTAQAQYFRSWTDSPSLILSQPGDEAGQDYIHFTGW